MESARAISLCHPNLLGNYKWNGPARYPIIIKGKGPARYLTIIQWKGPARFP